MINISTAFCIVSLIAISSGVAGATTVPRFAVHEVTLSATGNYAHPYVELEAHAQLTEPDGQKKRFVPLFWDGGATWRFRFAADKTGTWKWSVTSADAGLNGQSGSFDVIDSDRNGSIRLMRGHPLHFERQDGARFWFMGDTAWALYNDNETEELDRDAAKRYVGARAGQGFNVLHSSLLSEAGWHNRGGPPFHDIAAEKINPAYWQEVDHRLAYANSKGCVCGLALAWGDKRKVEPYAWRMFPSIQARKRYARYIASRYSAFDVYFIVAGEWHAEVRTRPSTEPEVQREFIDIGDVVRASDPHGRMTAIHPMTAHGSVREFNEAAWMSFGDYQQNYQNLHARILESRRTNKPVVNSEYGYFLRDQSGDGVPDKDNSTSIEAMRFATWDIVMAGGYVVTGFGTTYFGGNRDPGPFDVDAVKNDPWEAQMSHMKTLFTSVEWWKLVSHDDLLRSNTPRGGDSRELKQLFPPRTTYWCLAEPGKQYLLYVRGLREPVNLSTAAGVEKLKVRQWNPRTGEFMPLSVKIRENQLQYTPPDEQDWIVVLN